MKSAARYEDIAVYILASGPKRTLYIGVTGALRRRSYEHKVGMVDGFTKKYGVTQLVWYELHPTMESAIHREKRLKKYTRAQKINLIESMNPQWLDMYETIC